MASAMIVGTNRITQVDEALDLRLARLRVLRERRHLGELGVRADSGRADLEPRVRADGAAGHVVADPNGDGHRLAGQRRGVDRRRPADHDAVGGDGLAGSTMKVSPCRGP